MSHDIHRLKSRLHTRTATPFEAANHKRENHRRAASFGKIDAERRTAELSFSSDVELERWPGFIEKLSHERDAVDLSRLESGASCLFNHDWDQPIGVVESVVIESGKGRAVIRFGESDAAEERWKDVRSGVLRNVSVGYRIIDLKEEKRDGKTIATVTRWQPYEVSIVTVPADISVGVGRDATPTTHLSPTSTMNRAQIIAALKERGIAYNDTDTDEQLQSKLDSGKRASVTAPAGGADDRVRKIIEMGKQYGERDLASDYAAEGKSVEQFREALLEKVAKRNAAAKTANSEIGLSDKEVRAFSVVKLLRALDTQGGNQKRAIEDAAFELEACAAATERTMGHRSVKGTIIPLDVLRAPLDTGRRDIVSIKTGSGYTGTGGNLVSTQLLSSSFVELLTNRSVLMNLATKLGGLVGNVDIPKQLTGAHGYWIGEDTAATQSDVTFGQFGLRSKTCSTNVIITRKLLMQSSIDVEAFVRLELAKRLALTIDLAGFYADGTGNAPTGIKATSGVNAVDFAAALPTWAELVQMETECEADNISAEASRYIFNARMRGHFKTTKKFPAGNDSATIWEAGGTVNGYPSEVTNQIETGDVFYGDFSELLVGMWGGLEINLDPYTDIKKGALGVVAMQDVDFALRRPEAITFGKQLTP